MKIQLWSNPKFQYEELNEKEENWIRSRKGERKSIPVTYDFNTGVTMLIGPNGAGKSTLLRQLNSLFKEHNWTKINSNDKIRDKYFVYYYDNVYEEKFAKDSWIQDNSKIERIATTFQNSEGQDMQDYLFYKVPEIGRTVRYAKENNYNGIFILLDGLDSGLSLDNLEQIRTQLLDFIINTDNRDGFEVYIICSANSFEFCNNYDCIDVTNQEHYIFNEYWEFRNHFIKEENK